MQISFTNNAKLSSVKYRGRNTVFFQNCLQWIIEGWELEMVFLKVMCFFSLFSKFPKFVRNFVKVSVTTSFTDFTKLNNLEIILGRILCSFLLYNIPLTLPYILRRNKYFCIYSWSFVRHLPCREVCVSIFNICLNTEALQPPLLPLTRSLESSVL